MTVTAPPPLERDSPEALIEEARQRARRRRRGYAIALGVAVLAGVVSYLLVGRDGGDAAGPARGERAFGVGPSAFRAGQFWYTRTISSQHKWMPAGGITVDRRGYTHWHGPHVLFDLRVSEETWVGLDGTLRDRAVISDVHFASAAGRAQWAAYRHPIPNFNRIWLGWMSHDGITVGEDRFPPVIWGSLWGEWLGPSGWDVGDSLFSYRQLLSLPSQPAALLARLKQAERALARREAHISPAGRSGTQAGAGNLMTGLTTQSDALGELSDIARLLIAPLPASLRLALFHAAVTMPGVSVDRHARDSLGRPGVAVSASPGRGRVVPFEQLIFDPATGALLGEAPEFAVVAQGVVDSPYRLPKGVKPIQPVGAPPAAAKITMSPAVGDPMSTFKLMLSAPARPGQRRPPSLAWMLIGTPGGGCFAGFLPQPVPLVPSSSIRRAGSLTYIYNLMPALNHRRTWCPGRYELNVLPTSRGTSSMGSSNLTAGVGSSIFLQVR